MIIVHVALLDLMEPFEGNHRVVSDQSVRNEDALSFGDDSIEKGSEVI
jgi:hypothetical protein